MQNIDGGRSRPLVQALRRRRSLRAGIVQLLYIVVGVILGVLVAAVDVGPRIPSGETVALLAGITAGLLALASVVFALLFLVVQFAATAQSPRLHLFRDNPLVWHCLGLIVGVMVYATASAVMAGGQDTTSVLVPSSVVFLVLVAVALTRRLQFDALQSVQLAPALDRVTTRTRQVIDRLYTAPFPQPPVARPVAPEHPVQVHWPAPQTVLRQVDMPKLIDLAEPDGAIIRLLVMPGDLIRERAVVMEVWHPATDGTRTVADLEVGIERSFHPGSPVRFSPAERHGAPGDVDGDQRPGLRRAGHRLHREPALDPGGPRPRGGLIVDDTGTPRVLFDAPDWEEFLAAGADEIAEAPMQPMVRRRLRAMLEHLVAVAPIERRASDSAPHRRPGPNRPRQGLRVAPDAEESIAVCIALASPRIPCCRGSLAAPPGSSGSSWPPDTSSPGLRGSGRGSSVPKDGTGSRRSSHPRAVFVLPDFFCSSCLSLLAIGFTTSAST